MQVFADIDVLREQIQQIERELIQLETSLTDQSKDMIELRALERQAAAERAVHERFLTRLTEARERGDFQQADARIIAFADPPNSAASPKRALLTVVSLVMGSAIAAGVILLLESRREVFRTASETAAATGLPVLASVPAVRGRGADRWLRPSPEIAQSVGRVALQMELSLGDAESGRSLLVASALPDEGGSDLLVLMAQSLARAGRRVVIVNADATSESLFASLAPDSETPQRAAGFDFDMCSIGGPVIPGAAAARHAMARNLIARLRGTYDIVLVNSPPLLASLDALMPPEVIDGMLLVVAWDRTPQGALREVMGDVARIETPVVGIAMTGVNTKVAALYEYWGASSARARVKSYVRRQGALGKPAT